MRTAFLAVIILGASISPAQAGWKMMPPNVTMAVGRGRMLITPSSEWNRSSLRPANSGESWTKDGFGLNQLDLFSGIAAGQPIYRERNRKQRPLPRYRNGMLAPDLVELFEANFSIAKNVTLFTIDLSEPSRLGGQSATHIAYSYAENANALRMKGEAWLAVVSGSLTIVNFTAPTLHYFDATISEVRNMAATARFR